MASLEAATNELEGMTLRAAEYVIENKLYARMRIPPIAEPLIEASWHAEHPAAGSGGGAVVLAAGYLPAMRPSA